MRGTARYEGSEITVEFSAWMVRADYGVPGSPVWWEPNGYGATIESLEILGEAYDPRDLPEKLRRSIMQLADECEWEIEE